MHNTAFGGENIRPHRTVPLCGLLQMSKAPISNIERKKNEKSSQKNKSHDHLSEK